MLFRPGYRRFTEGKLPPAERGREKIVRQGKVIASGRLSLAIPLAFGLLLPATILMSGCMSQPSTTTTEQVPPAPPQHPVITQTVVDSEFTVAPSYNGYQYYKVTVPDAATNASVDGHFWARGGEGNDIRVYVLSEDSMVNFQNHHSTSTFFNSDRMTQEAIQANLPGPGNYYVVFDNTFESDTQKTVKALVNLHYTK